MITQRQLRANRRNAKKSTGPRTPEGRAACRLNALKHGLAAADVILPSAEDQTAFAQLRAAFEQEYRPSTPAEQQTLYDLVAARWRLERAQTLESRFFNDRIDQYDSPQDAAALIFHDDSQSSDTLATISRYETRFDRAFYKSLNVLRGMRDLRKCPISGMGPFGKTLFQRSASPRNPKANPSEL